MVETDNGIKSLAHDALGVSLSLSSKGNSMKKSTIVKSAKKQATRKATTKRASKAKTTRKANAKQTTKQVKVRKARSSGFTFVQGAKEYGTMKEAQIFGARGYDVKREAGAEIREGDIIKVKYGYCVAACNVKDVSAEVVKFKRDGYAKLRQGETIKGVKMEAGTKVEVMRIKGNDDYGRKGNNIVHGCMTYLAARIKRGGKWLTFGAEVNRWHKVETVLVDLIKA